MSDTGKCWMRDLAHYKAMIATISGNLAAYAPLTAADMTASGVLRDDMDDKLLMQNQTQAAGTAVTAAKNAVRKAMNDDKRKIRLLLKANGVSDEAFTALWSVRGPLRRVRFGGDRPRRDGRHERAAAPHS